MKDINSAELLNYFANLDGDTERQVLLNTVDVLSTVQDLTDKGLVESPVELHKGGANVLVKFARDEFDIVPNWMDLEDDERELFIRSVMYSVENIEEDTEGDEWKD